MRAFNLPPPAQPDAEQIRRHLAPKWQLYDVDAARSGDGLFVRMGRAFQAELDDLRRATLPKWAYFEFIGHGAINARAVADSDDPRLHYVGMNVGVVPGMLDVAAAILADPALLPDVGDPSVEVPPDVDFSAGFTPHALLVPLPGTPTGFTMTASRASPRDDARGRYAWLLTLLIAEYTFLHETAHVVAGHTNYAATLGLTLEATGSVCRTDAEAGQSQLMEADADWFAFSTLPVTLLERSTVLFDAGRLSGWSDDELLQAWALATTIYFRVCDQRGSPFDDYIRTTHPHPDLRFVACQEATFDTLTRNGRAGPAGRWQSIHERALHTVATAWRRMRVPGGFYTNLSDGAGVRREYARLIDGLPRIREAVRRWDMRQAAG